MAKKFHYSLDRRIINQIIIWLLKLGLAPSIYYLLTVRGRKSGQLYSVPIVVIEEDNHRWLVAPYGEVDWVRNARASGSVTLTRKQISENLTIRELNIEEAAPILKKYLEAYPLTKPYFNAAVDEAPENFLEDAKTRPVFELVQEEER